MKRFFVLLVLITCSSLSYCHTIKMIRIGNTYRIQGTVNGLPLDFILDTGASKVSISLSEAIFMIKNGYLKEADLLNTEYYKLANGEIAEGTSIILRTIQIGDLTIKNVEASIVHTSDAPLLFGQSALEKLGKVTIDYENDILILGEKKEVEAPAIGSVVHYIVRGTEKFEREDYQGAISEYNKALVSGSNSSFYSFCYAMRGLSYLNIGENYAAIIDFDKSISIDSSKTAIYGRAMANLKLENYSEAVKDLDLVIAFDPVELEYYIDRGDAYCFNGRYTDAIKDYEHVLTFEPKNNSAYFGRIRALIKLNSLKQALLDLNKYVKEEKQSSEAYYCLSLVMNSQEKFNSAKKYLDKSLALEPQNVEALILKGILNAKMNKYVDAILDLTNALEIDPQNKMALRFRADFKFKVGDKRGSLVDYDLLVEAYPADADSYLARGVNKGMLHLHKESIADLNIALELNSKLGVAYLMRGFSKAMIGDINGACVDFSTAGQLGVKEAYDQISEFCQ
jgi:clan AA aspartic protease (TIGR02281 family)